MMAPLCAQQQGPTFRTRTELVLVPVVVTDGKGEPVSGLKAEEFRVIEEDKQQSLVLFEEIRAVDAPVRRVKRDDGVATNQLGGERGMRNLVVLVLDAVNTPVLDQTYARRHLVNYLGEYAKEGQLTALMLMHRNGVRLIQDFTTDPAIVRQAVERVRSSMRLNESEMPVVNTVNVPPPTPVPDMGATEASTVEDLTSVLESFLSGDEQYEFMQRENALRTTMAGLQQIAHAVSGLPGRKSIIWATAGFPYELGKPSEFSSRNLGEVYTRTFRVLNDANAALYPVDVRGLQAGGRDPFAGSTSKGTWGGIAPSQIERDMIPIGITNVNFAIHSMMEQVAQMTGGRAFKNRNDLAKAFAAGAKDSEHYYLLGYYLRDGKNGWRKLEVQTRKGLNVRTRSGVVAGTSVGDPEALRRSDLLLASNSPMPFTALPMLVHMRGVVPGEGNKRKLAFEIELSPGVLLVDEMSGDVRVDFVALARNAQGETVGQMSQQFKTTIAPENRQEFMTNGVSYKNSLDVPAGEYRVRFIVRDHRSGKMGSVTVPLKVQ